MMVAYEPVMGKSTSRLCTVARVSMLSERVMFMKKMVIVLSSGQVKLPVHSLGINSVPARRKEGTYNFFI